MSRRKKGRGCSPRNVPGKQEPREPYVETRRGAYGYLTGGRRLIRGRGPSGVAAGAAADARLLRRRNGPQPTRYVIAECAARGLA